MLAILLTILGSSFLLPPEIPAPTLADTAIVRTLAESEREAEQDKVKTKDKRADEIALEQEKIGKERPDSGRLYPLPKPNPEKNYTVSPDTEGGIMVLPEYNDNIVERGKGNREMAQKDVEQNKDFEFSSAKSKLDEAYAEMFALREKIASARAEADRYCCEYTALRRQYVKELRDIVEKWAESRSEEE